MRNRLLSSLRGSALFAAALLGAFGAAYAVNISGTNSQNERSVFKMGYPRLSITDSITAFAGGGQANATLLDSAYNRVTTVASAGDSVKLPSCHTGAANTGQMPPGIISGETTGIELWVTNAASPTSMNIFPQLGESINSITVNVPYPLAGGKTAGFLCSPGGTIWYSVLGG
jgi:hypothetical protein